MLFGFGTPFAPNARMKDLFERAFFRRVAKYYRPKRGPVQVAGSRKSFATKFPADCFAHVGKINKLVGGLVGIEKFRGRQQFAQTMAKTALARADSTGDANRRHLSKAPSTKIQAPEKFQSSKHQTKHAHV